ncbi:hypothetical protein WJX77_009014 [Trebouxia sp. C0004]
MTIPGATFQIKAHLVRSRYISCTGNAAGLQAGHKQADARIPGRWASSSTHQALTATAIKAKPAALVIAALSPPSPSDQRRDASDTFIPLTKARKTATDLPPSRLQQTGKAARYIVLAVGAGVAMTALAVDITDAAIVSAVLAAGAAALPASSVGSNKRALHWDRDRAAPLFGALAPGLDAAQTLGQAFSRRPASGASAPSQRAPAPSQLTLPESAPAAELPQDVTESNWEDEEGGYPALPQLTDAQWAQVAKLIEDQPCRVPVTDALHFAQQFDASYKLPEEWTSQSVAQAGPQAAWPLPSNSCDQPAGQKLMGKRHSADQVRRQQKLKQKEKKKKRKQKKVVNIYLASEREPCAIPTFER